MNAPGSTSDLFTNPKRFADLTAWHSEADALRSAGPIHLINRIDDGFRPFHALLTHAAVLEVERQPELFTNHPDVAIGRTKDLERQRAAGAAVRTLVHMDAPDHPKYRKLTADWFKPGSLGRLQPRLDQLSAQTIDRMIALGGSCDFASDVAVWYPLQVILAILGLPESDYGRMLELTQEFFGSGTSSKGKRGMDEVIAAIQDMFAYFLETTLNRRVNPTDDLATVIANGLIDGTRIPDRETISYYIIVATAGHDTTSSSISGGLQALVENPDQLGLLKTNPALLNSAVDEMIRYVSPARHFMRTTQEDTTIAGHTVHKGDWIYLSYMAANRDPALFENPHTFDITRPNADKHLAFGFGAHFCLGAQLARMELRTLFRDLIPRLEHIELAETPTSTATTVVGGPKSLAINYRLSDPVW
jgi:cytochrome P450